MIGKTHEIKEVGGGQDRDLGNSKFRRCLLSVGNSTTHAVDNISWTPNAENALESLTPPIFLHNLD
jgi:hypothetical protein